MRTHQVLTITLAVVAAGLSLPACGSHGRTPTTTRATTTAVPTTMSVSDAGDPRAALAAQRALQIQRLHDYRLAARFPANVYVEGWLNVFQGEDGSLCAVANLIHQSGRDDLVAQVVRENNFVALRDVHDGPIMDWILASGLTHEETVMIQGIGYEFGVEGFNVPVEQRQGQQWQLALDAKLKTLQASLALAEQTLRAQTEESLDLAVARLTAPPPETAVASAR
jgi:hypothetical protein